MRSKNHSKITGLVFIFASTLSGCASVPAITANKTGCPEAEITISNFYGSTGGGKHWTAECKGMTYTCDQNIGNAEIVCRETPRTAPKPMNPWNLSCDSLEKKMKSFVGKTVWFSPVHNEGNGCIESSALPPAFSKLTIAEAHARCEGPNLSNAAPGAAGHSSFSDPTNQTVYLTLSNGSKQWQGKFYRFDYVEGETFEQFFYHAPNQTDECFYPFDPKARHPALPWTRIIKNASAGRFPPIGASKQETVFTLGKPTETHKTVIGQSATEQWVYKDLGAYLYFDGDSLKAHQQ